MAGDKRMPFEWVGATGELEGFSGEYLRLLLHKESGGHIVTRQFDDLPELVDAACSGKVDLVTSVDVTLPRARCLVYSAPYLRDNAAFLGRRDDRGAADDDRLRGARIGVMRGSVYVAGLHARYPGSTIVQLRAEDVVPAVRQRRVDVFFGTSAVLDYELGMVGDDHDLAVIRRMPETQVQLHFAASLGSADLIHWIDARQIEIPNGTMQDLMNRWFGMRVGSPVPSPNIQLALTEDDRRYLRSLPTLKIGYGSEWAPITYLGATGRFQGLASDYLDYLERTLGVRFERPPVERWPAILREFANGDLDLVVGARNSVPADRTVIRSEPIDTFPLVVVLPKSMPTVTGIQDLRGKRVGVLNGRIEDRPARDFLRGANIVPVSSDVDGYDWLAGGKLDAYVSNIAVADLMLKTRYNGELRTSIPIGRQQDVVLIMQAKYARLNQLVDRALAVLPESDRAHARNKWITARYNYGVSWSDVFQRLLPVVLCAAVMFALVLVAYLRQRAEARRRAHAESLLETQLAIQQTLMETLPYPVMAIGADGHFLLVNNAAVEMLGDDSDAIRGRDINSVSGRFPIVRQLFVSGEEGAEADESTLRELAYMDRSGMTRVMLYRIAPLTESDGERAGVIAALVDVTDTRVAQEREVESAQRLAEVTRDIPAVVFQVRRKPDGPLQFSFVGGNVGLLFGISAERVMECETNLLERVLAEDRAALMAEVERSARILEPANVSFRTCVDSRILWIRGQATPVLLSDGSVQWSGYWVDTTVERLQADALRAAHDLALKASNAKDEFLAMMSHEIRTPMNGVLGLVELLGDTSLDPGQAHMLGLIQGSASTLLQVLDDILDYSKIEAGQLTLEPTSMEIRTLCDSVIGLIAGRAREKGIKLRVVVDAQVGARLRVDGVRLRQILFNLIGNAIKFTESGSVTLRICVVDEITEIDGGRRMQMIEFRVEDTGIGVQPEQQAAIFAPFSQADCSITRRFGGTGLGLTICSKLVKMMDGEMRLSSQLGHGTVVTIRLRLAVECSDGAVSPLASKRVRMRIADQRIVDEGLRGYVSALGGVIVENGHVDLEIVSESVDTSLPIEGGMIVVTDHFESSAMWVESGAPLLCANPLLYASLEYACEQALKHTSQSALRGRTIVEQGENANLASDARRVLVAEDNSINSEMMVSQLRALGFACDVARDGIVALKMIEARDYGILLTDCHMPLCDGFQLTQAIRARESGTGRRLIVVGVTASTLARDRQRGVAAGMDDWLTKPAGLAELRACLKKWLTEDVMSPARETVERLPDLAGYDPDIDKLRTLYPQNEDLKAFVNLFIMQFSVDLDELHRFNAAGDLDALQEQMHRIAGALSVLGLQEWQLEIADMRKGLSSMAQASRSENIEKLLGRGRKFVAMLERQLCELDSGEPQDR
nr:transporter substrate-binding domain-containing protein [Burkholderia metallica]